MSGEPPPALPLPCGGGPRDRSYSRVSDPPPDIVEVVDRVDGRTTYAPDERADCRGRIEFVYAWIS